MIIHKTCGKPIGQGRTNTENIRNLSRFIHHAQLEQLFIILLRQVLTHTSSVDTVPLRQVLTHNKGANNMKTTNNVTLYELMAEDMDIWITKNKKFGFDLQIDNKEGEAIVDEQGIHPFAMESYADMCRRFLHFYDMVKAQSELEFNLLIEAA